MNSPYANRPSVYAPSVSVVSPQGGMPVPAYFVSPHTNLEATVNSMRDAFSQKLADIHNLLAANATSPEELAAVHQATTGMQNSFENELPRAASVPSASRMSDIQRPRPIYGDRGVVSDNVNPPPPLSSPAQSPMNLDRYPSHISGMSLIAGFRGSDLSEHPPSDYPPSDYPPSDYPPSVHSNSSVNQNYHVDDPSAHTGHSQHGEPQNVGGNQIQVSGEHGSVAPAVSAHSVHSVQQPAHEPQEPAPAPAPLLQLPPNAPPPHVEEPPSPARQLPQLPPSAPPPHVEEPPSPAPALAFNADEAGPSRPRRRIKRSYEPTSRQLRAEHKGKGKARIIYYERDDHKVRDMVGAYETHVQHTRNFHNNVHDLGLLSPSREESLMARYRKPPSSGSQGSTL